MTQRIRHRWTIAGTPAIGQLEPHELAVDHGQRQLFTSETGAGREPMLPVTWFDERGTYAVDDIVAYQGLLWVAKEQVLPGPFDATEWFKMNEADVGTAIDDAIAAHEAEPDPHPVYATDADLTAHSSAIDPHPQYATDADLAAHVAAADPHPQYATDADLSLAVPPGTIMMWPGAAAPAGWALCQGQAYSTASNPKLFAVLGAATLPDMRGAFPRGLDAGRGYDAGRALNTLQGHAFASHAHGVNDPGHAHSVYDPGHAHSAWTDAQGDHNHYVNDPGHAHGNGGSQQQWALRNENWAIFYIRQQSQGEDGTRGAGTGIWLNNAGSHAHNVGVGGSGTGIGIYGAGTGLSIQAAGGAGETRPVNVALNFIIKLG